MALLAYGPALRAGFVWNDSDYVTEPALRSLGGLFRIWFEVGATEQFYPVLHTTFWLQHQVWGDSATAYHVFNVLLHATSASLLVLVLRRLRAPGAALAGLLYAAHPVCVESVAWISEQKNTLSLVFYLAAMFSYLRFDATRSRRAHAVAAAWFALAVLAKSVTATLPAALLVVIWWQRGRLEWRRDVRPLLLWFAGGAAFGLFSAWVEHTFIGADGPDFLLSPVERGLLAGRVAWFYAGKVLWPAGLVFFYPRWQIDAGDVWQWLYPIAALGLVFTLWRIRGRTRGPLAAVLFFGGSLFPTMGFFNVYAFKFSYVADHWQYLPCLGLIVLLAGASDQMAQRVAPRLRWMVRGGGGAAVVALALVSAQHSRGYRDGETLYRTILRENPGAWLAHNNLGLHLVETGRVQESLAHFQETLRLRPDHAETLANLGGALLQLGRLEEAAPLLEKALGAEALRRRPSYAELQANWAMVLLRTQRPQEAIGMLQAAVQRKPELAVAHNLLGLALGAAGRNDEAAGAFEAALRLRPAFAEAHLNLAKLHALQQRLEAAALHYEEGLRLAPGMMEAHRDAASVLLRLRQPARAVPHLEAVVCSRPEDAEMRANLGLALGQAGRRAEGIAQCEEALRHSPGHPTAERFLAALRAPEAVEPNGR